MGNAYAIICRNMLAKLKASKIRSTAPDFLAQKRRGEQAALALFRDCSVRVPAYKDFLNRNHINPDKVKTIEDFQQVPLVDKKNYLTQYSLAQLSWDGDLFNSRVLSVSSGSTGAPFFWPRGAEQDAEGAWMHEQIYRHIFQADQKSSLVVVCFSMGTWIAGAFTASSSLGVVDKGYKMNVITPGIDRDEAVKVIRELSMNYDQVILCGYPPFLKDVVDQGNREGINWKKTAVKMLFAGEAFSEEWRDYVLQSAGNRTPHTSSVNVYGTADAAMVGHETPASITARRLYGSRGKLRRELFGTPIVPSLVQYYPERRYFEAVDSELVFTARAGIPLVRYNIHDTGGVLGYEDVVGPIQEAFDRDVARLNLDITPWQLPFIYLNGRKDFTATIYAVNIYPENIKAALVDPKMRSWVTGKFTMATKYHSDMEQYFEINIELAAGIADDNTYLRVAKETVIEKLSKLNAEFKKLHAAVGVKAEPQLHLIPYGDTAHFGRGVKHRWVKKNG